MEMIGHAKTPAEAAEKIAALAEHMANSENRDAQQALRKTDRDVYYGRSQALEEFAAMVRGIKWVD